MHRAFWIIPIFAAFLALPSVVQAADPPLATAIPHLKGMWLTTDYPSVAAQDGQTTSIKLKLQNYGLPPERVALSVDGAPEGWRAMILGKGTPVTAAMPSTDKDVPLTLRVDVPANASKGTQHLVVHAKYPGGSADLPIDVTTGTQLPAQLALKAQLPSLDGTPTTSFGYQFNVKNDSDKDLLVKLVAKPPQGFQTNFTEAYGTQQLSSIPIEAGKNKDMKVNVTPPANVTAGTYPVEVVASADGATAATHLTMNITGQPKLSLSGENDRLSAQAEAGEATPIHLVVRNNGSAPASDIELSSSPPSDWKVTFQPDKIPTLAPNEKRTVQALLTPSAKAVAGDYMTTFNANGKDDSTSADFRITVATSTLWGLVGVGFLAIALLVAVGAVARYGRR
ncbi:MAG TPA: NEW3 domain-containing protein [Stellaceae bacterium]|nr:NEW3 domain-containing protein [Stellaceae bacterium]